MHLDLPAALRSPSAKVLDAGGWFIPFNDATHVVDLMPYETRGGVLHPGPLPGERFSKDTWHQVDFLATGFRLPFPDKFFDFSVCGHTVEDLADATGLLSELQRVSRAGYIETPSRLCEQTVGVRDRMTGAQGHPHHHWIVEAENNRLRLSLKATSLQGARRRHAVPLRTYESILNRNAGSAVMGFYWKGDLAWDLVPADETVRLARACVDSCHVTAADRMLDPLVRNLRRLKRRLLYPAPPKSSDWWQEMLTLSRPYSTIPL